MKKGYEHLNAEERATIKVMKGQSASVRAIVRMLGRCCSTTSREVQRNTTKDCVCSARRAGERARELRGMQRRRTKLSTDSVLFDVVRHYFQEGWSPEQIAGTLKRVFVDDSSKTVTHETIYNAIYVMPRSELRTKLFVCPRQGRNSRRPRSGGVDRSVSTTPNAVTRRSVMSARRSLSQCNMLKSVSTKPGAAQIEVIDIRPLGGLGHEQIKFKQANLMELEESLYGLCDSLSCLHALEHFGLGRYGDPIDPLGLARAL